MQTFTPTLSFRYFYARNASFHEATLFCSLVTVMASVIYWLLRAGFADRSEAMLVRLTGVAFFVLFAPLAAAAALRGREAGNAPGGGIFHGAFQLVLLLGLGLLGWAGLPGLPVLAYLLSTAGFALAGVYWYSFFTTTPAYRSGYLVLLALLFSAWALSNTLRPAILEGVVAGVTHIDYWFSISVAQMLKTYGVSSTGLDGMPWLYYHYGSHWYLGQLSGVLGIAVRDMYAVGYSILFVPLFFQAYLHFALHARSALPGVGALPQRLNFGFWLLVLCIFIQVIKNLYSGVLLGFNFLESESFVLGLTAFFLFAAGCLAFWTHRSRYHPAWERVFLLGIVPAFALLLGFLKVSVLYNALSLAGYLFLRLGLYKKRTAWFSLLLLLAASGWVYFQAVETLTFGGRRGSAEGTLFPLYFYRETHPFEPVNFFVFFFQWTYLLILLTVLIHRLYTGPRWRAAVRQGHTLAAECAVAVAVAGLLPSLVLFLTGPDAMYFSGPQILFSSALVLACLPAFRLSDYVRVDLRSPAYRVAAGLAATGILLLLYMYTRFAVNDLVRTNAQVRKNLLGDASPHQFTVSEAAGLAVAPLLGPLSPAQERFRHWYSPAVQQALEGDSTHRYLQRLAGLDSLPAGLKRQSLVYVDVVRQLPPYRIPCHVFSFMTPALTGMAALDGVLYNCVAGGYTFEYYATKPADHPGWDRQYGRAELLEKARRHGKSKIILLTNGRFEVYPAR